MSGADWTGSNVRRPNSTPASATYMSRKSATLNPKTMGADLRASCSLTQAEWRAVQGLAKGKRAADIAAAQGISVHTVRTHLKRAMAKVGVHSQIALVARVFSGFR